MPGITLPAKTLLAVFAASLSLLGLASAAQAPAATFTFGLADYEPATFSDPRVAALGVHTARDVVPWNVALVPRDRAAVTAWLAAVRRASITPLITFQHAGNNSARRGRPSSCAPSCGSGPCFPGSLNSAPGTRPPIPVSRPRAIRSSPPSTTTRLPPTAPAARSPHQTRSTRTATSRAGSGRSFRPPTPTPRSGHSTLT